MIFYQDDSDPAGNDWYDSTEERDEARAAAHEIVNVTPADGIGN